jgi:hypothetical protein
MAFGKAMDSVRNFICTNLRTRVNLQRNGKCAKWLWTSWQALYQRRSIQVAEVEEQTICAKNGLHVATKGKSHAHAFGRFATW